MGRRKPLRDLLLKKKNGNAEKKKKNEEVDKTEKEESREKTVSLRKCIYEPERS